MLDTKEKTGVRYLSVNLYSYKIGSIEHVHR